MSGFRGFCCFLCKNTLMRDVAKKDTEARSKCALWKRPSEKGERTKTKQESKLALELGD